MTRKGPTLLEPETRFRRMLHSLAYGAGMLVFWLALIEAVALLIWAMCSTLEAIR